MPLWNAPQATVAEVEAAAAAAAAAQQTADQALDDASVVKVQMTMNVTGLGGALPTPQRVIAPITGVLESAALTAAGQPNANVVVTPSIGGVPVTDGAVTLLSGDAAGTVRTAVATGANAVVEGVTTIVLTSTAVGNTVAFNMTLTLTYRRS